ncbi:MAG: purine-binding chemotaxis protein CheW [Methyloversatilis sp.]|nr:purine-binding chemotaxis protein CheW [Methyloversatilis sp.]
MNGRHSLALTVVDDDDAAADQQQQYLTFRLGEESYALGLLSVKEIIEYGGVTQVPMMPGFVRGVINLRGRVVPVIDLANRLRSESAAVTRRTCIVIVEVANDGEAQDMGIIVDAVSQVVDIPPQSVEPGPSFGAKVRADFIAGMGKLDDGFVIMLDIDRVLAGEDMAAVNDMKAAG